MARRSRIPPELRRMLESLTEQDKLRKFHMAFEREPKNDEEVEAFIHKLARGLYNEGWDEWPENDEEVD